MQRRAEYVPDADGVSETRAAEACDGSGAIPGIRFPYMEGCEFAAQIIAGGTWDQRLRAPDDPDRSETDRNAYQCKQGKPGACKVTAGCTSHRTHGKKFFCHACACKSRRSRPS